MKFCQVTAIFFALLLSVSNGMGQEISKTAFRISSPAFENKGQIPSRYTCDGININPPLQIENIPKGIKSLALIFDDLDAPGGSYVHWILWNIYPTIKEIRENSVPESAVQGMNGFKKQNYGGPCPPRRAHRYVFKIYALDILLHLDPNSTKTDLEKKVKDHVIGQAQLLGVYQRKGSSTK